MKLTSHITTRYIGFTIVVLLISIPATYFVLLAVMNANIDENLRFQQKWIEEKLQTVSPQNFISFDNEITIRPGKNKATKEHFYNKDIYEEDENEMVPYRVMEFNTTVNGNSYFVRIQKSLLENDDILQVIVGIQLLVLILLFVSLIFINKYLNKKVWKPFYNTLDTLQKFRIDKDKPLQLPNQSITELDNLNKSLNELTKHNREIYITQKEFTENASHELQTPLALMQSDLDLLWQTSPLSEEQAQLLQNLTEANSRMSKLSKSMLMLAKIENHQFTDKKEIDLAKLVEKWLEKLESVFSQRNIEIYQRITPSSRIVADETLMETLFGNLISNALHYTPQNGTVEIELNSSMFKIGNSGNGKPLDKEKLFKRFQKQDNSQKSGNGLGLEICKRICDLNNFKISYDFFNVKHWFTITF